MNNTVGTTKRVGIKPHQISPDIDQHIEERITASPQVKAIVSTLAELVPGFAEDYKTRIAEAAKTDLHLIS